MSISAINGGAQPTVATGASMRQPPQQKMSQLFDKIDTANAGSISKPQFQQAFQTMNPPARLKALGAEQIWSKLDAGGTGSVSKPDFVNTMKGVIQSGATPSGAAARSASQTANAATQALNMLL
jgi:Ca2+-binding EF-hand superfamily protein